MRRFVFLFAAVSMLAGCAYHPQPVKVFGQSGAAFQAPTLCEALLACKKSESACYYDSSTYAFADGTKTESACVEVKK